MMVKRLISDFTVLWLRGKGARLTAVAFPWTHMHKAPPVYNHIAHTHTHTHALTYRQKDALLIFMPHCLWAANNYILKPNVTAPFVNLAYGHDALWSEGNIHLYLGFYMLLITGLHIE